MLSHSWPPNFLGAFALGLRLSRVCPWSLLESALRDSTETENRYFSYDQFVGLGVSLDYVMAATIDRVWSLSLSVIGGIVIITQPVGWLWKLQILASMEYFAFCLALFQYYETRACNFTKV